MENSDYTLTLASDKYNEQLTILKEKNDLCARLDALDFLMSVHPLTIEIIDALIVNLHDSNKFIRSASIKALGECKQYIPRIVPALLQELKDINMQSEVIETFERLGYYEPDLIQPLVDVLLNQNSPARGKSATLLGKLGTSASPALIESLNTIIETQGWHSPHDPLWTIVVALKDQGSVAVPYIRIALQDRNLAGISLLIQAIGTNNIDLLDNFISLLTHPDWNVRWEVIKSLRKIGKPAIHALPALGPVLRKSNTWELREIIEFIKELGPSALALVPDLIVVLRDLPNYDYYLAADGLKAIGSKAVPLLIEELQNENNPSRHYVVKVLAQIAPSNNVVESALLKTLNSKDVKVRYESAFMLANRNLSLDKAIPVILVAAEDTGKYWQRDAQEVLKKLGDNAEKYSYVSPSPDHRSKKSIRKKILNLLKNFKSDS